MVIRYAPAHPPQRASAPRAPLAFPGGGILPYSIRLAEHWDSLCARARRRRLKIALAALLPLAGASAIAALQTPLYQSSASIFVDPQGGRAGRSETPADAAAITGQLRLATSRTVLQRAVEQRNLAADPALRPDASLFARAARALLGIVGIDSERTNASPAGITQILAQSIKAQAGSGANLIDISAVTADAAASARLANAVAQAFVEEVIASADAAAGSERSRLTKRGDDLKARLQDAEARLAQFRARNGLEGVAPGRPGTEADGVPDLARARLATSEARTRYEQLQRLIATGKEPEAIADLVRIPSLERLKAQYAEAAAQEVSFRSSLGPRHPAYLEMQQQAREKKRLLQEGLRLALAAARVEWQSAREQEQALEKRGGSEAVAPVASLPAPTQLRELERDVEIARAAYDRFLKPADASDAAAQAAASRIVTPAAVPTSALSQGRGKLFGGALGLSFLFAGLTLLGRDRTSDVRRPAPQAPTQQASAPVRILRRSASTATRGEGQAPDAAAAPVATKASPTQPKPMPAAPINPAAVLTGVDQLAHELALTADEFALQTILSTAMQDTHGKSQATMALARAAQRNQLRVLIIDADERDGGLTDLYGAGPVAGTIPIQGRMRPLVIAEGGPLRVCLIPLESKAPTPPNLATLPVFSSIAGNFDLVIIDGPVMTGTLFERKLARASQAVMLACPADTMPAMNRVASLLGCSPELVRVVQPSSVAAADPTAPAGKPMGVVRLRKVA